MFILQCLFPFMSLQRLCFVEKFTRHVSIYEIKIHWNLVDVYSLYGYDKLVSESNSQYTKIFLSCNLPISYIKI